jgi:hypothetical protein
MMKRGTPAAVMQSEKQKAELSVLPEVRRAARDSTLVLLNPEAHRLF